MKLEVGMYVRTNKGHIDKIIKTDNRHHRTIKVECGEEEYCMGYWEFTDWFAPDHYIKANHNIIELLEEKDLVEIEYFSLRYNERVTRLFEVTFRDERYINLSNAKCEFMLINGEFNEGDKALEPIIKSVLTKEQFEAMAYKVE